MIRFYLCYTCGPTTLQSFIDDNFYVNSLTDKNREVKTYERTLYVDGIH